MDKRSALYDYFELDGVDLSNSVHRIGFASDDGELDVSGFNADGASESIPGARVRAVEIDAWITRGTGELRQVLYPLHRDQTVFDLVWRPNGGTSASSTNPELRGSVRLPSWSEGASRGEAETATLRLVAADATDPLEWYYT